jgi:hypothetical protein
MKNSSEKSFLDFLLSSNKKKKTRFRVQTCYCIFLVLMIGSYQYVTFVLKIAIFI